ncbi:MAG: hypothetical protein N3G20_00530, partial [Verrucomicrobiae bacterium]|nr:hypothetical protein [Verrucomicrobiae bacterium]
MSSGWVRAISFTFLLHEHSYWFIRLGVDRHERQTTTRWVFSNWPQRLAGSSLGEVQKRSYVIVIQWYVSFFRWGHEMVDQRLCAGVHRLGAANQPAGGVVLGKQVWGYAFVFWNSNGTSTSGVREPAFPDCSKQSPDALVCDRQAAPPVAGVLFDPP